MERSVKNTPIENVEEHPWLVHVAFRFQPERSLLLKSIRKQLAKKLKKRLKMTDKEFLDFILQSKVPDERICRELGVSKQTIKRWKEGRSSPHPAVRSSVIKAFNMAT